MLNYIDCPDCQGTGLDQYDELEECPECQGSGIVEVPEDDS